MFKILTNNDLLRNQERFVLPAILIFVGLASFGLGRLSAMGEQGLPSTSNNAPVAQTAAVVVGAPYSAKASQGGSNFVASKTGTKYYLPSCSGIAKIKEENKVWFTTVAEAQAAGYTAAANCPGL